MNRVIILWGLLLAWALWCIGFHDYSTGELNTALIVCAIVGTVLNTLNWEPQPKAARDQLTWVLRVAGNFAVPFAVSLTSQILE
ncbi:MAG: hypothetical protein KDH09_01690 [Chrysiogenetes bacterium]|nr:hypothetical protein [Chrysiogenetes bacterium]